MEIALSIIQERTLNLLSKQKDLPSPQGGSFCFRAVEMSGTTMASAPKPTLFTL
ncbi:hypothetical protein ACOHYD_04585 [Desulfobacterota bacterium M19]